jgi:hypothetical protein
MTPNEVEEAVEALLDGHLILSNGGEIKLANDEQTQPENGDEEEKRPRLRRPGDRVRFP